MIKQKEYKITSIMAKAAQGNPGLLRKLEDMLSPKVCVWKLTALMSHKRTIVTYVMAPKAPEQLFRLADKLQYPFPLDKLRTVSN